MENYITIINYHTRQNYIIIINTIQDKILEGENFGEFSEFYPIRQNFLVQLKKINFEKLSYGEYSPIYYPSIIVHQNFLSP